MINQHPKCGGCGEIVEAGEGVYDIANLVYMHYEEFDSKNKLHQEDESNKKTFNISDKIHVVSHSCVIAYTTRTGEAYHFDPQKIKPVTKLDDIKQE